MIVRRRFLTLIEILIVVTVLLFLAGVISINVRRALITQRFNTETGLFVDTIRLAQDMMLILSKDVHLRVQSGPGGVGIEYFIDVEGGAPRNWGNLIKRSRRVMESVHFIAFIRFDTYPIRENQMDLRFQSKGSMMSRGELRLSSHQDPFISSALRRAVCLKGYPHAIVSESIIKTPAVGEMWTSCGEEEEEKESFFEQLTLYTREEVLQDQQSKEENKSIDEPQQEEQKKDGMDDAVL